MITEKDIKEFNETSDDKTAVLLNIYEPNELAPLVVLRLQWIDDRGRRCSEMMTEGIHRKAAEQVMKLFKLAK